ncbi:hypothetical protein B9Z55_028323 [Caenorhabditis nigoni]|uniref:MRG domain-containing protein n=1 Tax=Caenorhabditis nigoni TaxID=1611254 RepID=A0A2G5SC98_9PELO|nr:hypothetical protein B9Z55_028323 [Caenorhabditis nigoni]
MAVLRARHAGILDEVKLTDGLGKIRVDDYKLVHSEKKVPRIPTEWTVVKILEELLKYFVDRQSVQAKIRKEMEDVNVDQEAKEFVYEQDAHEMYQNEAEFDYQMNEPV